MGMPVHIGEFSCYNTPNDVALRWFEDLFSVFDELAWGYAMWNFEVSFEIGSRNGKIGEPVDGRAEIA